MLQGLEVYVGFFEGYVRGIGILQRSLQESLLYTVSGCLCVRSIQVCKVSLHIV